MQQYKHREGEYIVWGPSPPRRAPNPRGSALAELRAHSTFWAWMDTVALFVAGTSFGIALTTGDKWALGGAILLTALWFADVVGRYGPPSAQGRNTERTLGND